jgi:dihydrofolate synthase/folylpolyglutamate synthase
MRRLLTALGSPQDAFRSIHVVGTNGKSSTVRMAAAILEQHGVRAGAYLSPHLVSFRERVRVADADLGEAELCRAIAEVARAAEKVDRTLEAGDRVTQFEALTPPRTPSSRARASRSPSSRPASAAAGTRRTSSAPRSSC